MKPRNSKYKIKNPFDFEKVKKIMTGRISKLGNSMKIQVIEKEKQIFPLQLSFLLFI